MSEKPKNQFDLPQRLVWIRGPYGVKYRRRETHSDVAKTREMIKNGASGYSLRYADNWEDAL